MGDLLKRPLKYCTGDTSSIPSSDNVELIDKETGIVVALVKRERVAQGLVYIYTDVRPFEGVKFKRYGSWRP